MELQQLIDQKIKQARQERLLQNDQLTLGQIIQKIEGLADKTATIQYDFEYYFPKSIDSWRGSYDELALDIHSGGGNELTALQFIDILKEAIDNTYTGYKGGEFTMSEETPVWVANYGNSGNTAVVDVGEQL